MFEKATPKWFLIIYSVWISLLGIFSIVLAGKGLAGTAFTEWFTILFVLFNILMLGYFLGKKYEMRSWAVPLSFLVFGFVTKSLINNFAGFISYEAEYFFSFLKTIFLLLFVLLVDILYLHPHVKNVPVKKKRLK